jgi:hydrogenase expression/formation protein HypC
MCLALPGRLLEQARQQGVALGLVDFGGVRKQICLELVPEAAPGDWLLVHAGFALRVVDEAVARDALEALRGPAARGGIAS